MELLNDMCDRVATSSLNEKKRVSSPNKERRMRMPQKEFLEKSLEMREEPERRETSSIDERRLTMDLPPSNPSEIKIKENLLEFNIEEISRTQDVRKTSTSKASQNVNRYSATKIKREALNRNTEFPANSFLNF
jgi:hypothetical protein